MKSEPPRPLIASLKVKVKPNVRVLATAGAVNDVMLGAVESTVTDVPDTNDKFPAASTEYAT